MTLIETVLDRDTSTEKGPVAHIVRVPPHKVTEAAFLGHPLEALCGHVFVPSRDPKKLPPCQRCVDIYEGKREDDPNLPERPSA